jgi:uncharacterized cupin superfamily protein
MRMSLDPGETFEHAHRGASITTLIEGRVDMIADGVRTALEVGVASAIGAAVSHVLVNVGDTVAVLDCTHEMSGSPVS